MHSIEKTSKAQSGKTAVVTGGGTGGGQAIPLGFDHGGWEVALVKRRKETLRETIALASLEERDRMLEFSCDVSDARGVAAMATDVVARFGDVDVLVNAAGINVPERSFEALSLDDWHAVLGTNLHGAYY